MVLVDNAKLFAPLDADTLSRYRQNIVLRTAAGSALPRAAPFRL
jgi:hypothetical protein